MTSSPLSPSSNAGSLNTRPGKPGRKLQPRRNRCRASMPPRSQRSATRWRSAQTRRALVLQNLQEFGKPASARRNPHSVNSGKTAIRIWFGTAALLVGGAPVVLVADGPALVAAPVPVVQAVIPVPVPVQEGVDLHDRVVVEVAQVGVGMAQRVGG